jgi:hypothetical protein
MKWRRLFRRDGGAPDERSRKGAELVELHAGSSLAIQKLERAIVERDRLADAVRNTVKAVRGELT